MSCKKEPIAQIAYLFFVDTQANAKKPKELFFATVFVLMKLEIIL